MFDFIKYIEPGNYYTLASKMPQAILCIDEDINQSIGYQLEISEKIDRAYFNLQRGVIPQRENVREPIQDLNVVDVLDNYIFIRRYFSELHVLSVLFLRLASLKNPIHELFCFFKSRRHKRVVIKPLKYDGFNKFESELIKSNPLVSVIIPTLNRYDYLKNVLNDLKKQDYKNFEVIICDQSEPFDFNFYSDWSLDIRIIRQEEKSLWLARNRCILEAKSDFIALSEDDVAIPTDWITNHLKCLDFFKIDMAAGVFYKDNGGVNLNSPGDCNFKLSSQFPTGNSCLRKSVFENVGLFDRQFEKQRMGDGEFGLRALLNGFIIVKNPKAFIIDIKAPVGGLREMGSWDALRPTAIFAPRPVPSVLYLIRKYFGGGIALLYLVKNIPQSFVPYKFKGNKLAKVIIYVLLPFWFIPALIAVVRSWLQASKKLKEGELIFKMR